MPSYNSTARVPFSKGGKVDKKPPKPKRIKPTIEKTHTCRLIHLFLNRYNQITKNGFQAKKTRNIKLT